MPQTTGKPARYRWPWTGVRGPLRPVDYPWCTVNTVPNIHGYGCQSGLTVRATNRCDIGCRSTIGILFWTGAVPLPLAP